MKWYIQWEETSNAEICWTHKLSKHGVHKQHDSVFFSCTNPLKLNTYCVYALLHTGVLVFALCFPYSFRSSFYQFRFVSGFFSISLSQFYKIKNNWIKWLICSSGVLKWTFQLRNCTRNRTQMDKYFAVCIRFYEPLRTHQTLTNNYLTGARIPAQTELYSSWMLVCPTVCFKLFSVFLCWIWRICTYILNIRKSSNENLFNVK